MKLAIYLAIAAFLTPSVCAQPGEFDLNAVKAGDIGNSGWADFDAPKIIQEIPFYTQPKAAEAGYAGGADSGDFLSVSRVPLTGSTLEWARNQGAPISGLTSSEQWASCGLIAAEALNRFVLKAPSLNKIVEIRNIAARNGRWNQNVGMYGPGAEQALLADLGIQTDLNWVTNLGQAERMVIKSIESGKPVIISTRRHYFFVGGHNNGRLFVGYTGRIMGNYGGSAQMSLAQISQAGNGSLAILLPK